jgi:D-arabinose 1-dehydrogenase-like Zn-dependent alcohol dehydrogenase
MRELRLLGSKATSLAELETVLDLLARGRIRAHVAQTLPLDRAARAHAFVERGAVDGRVVLVP